MGWWGIHRCISCIRFNGGFWRRVKGVIINFNSWGWCVRDCLSYGLICISLRDSCCFLESGVHYVFTRIERDWSNLGIRVLSSSRRSKAAYWLLWPTKELLADPLRPLYLFIIIYLKSSYIKSLEENISYVWFISFVIEIF